MCLNDRHILVSSNQQTRYELKGQLCVIRNTGKLYKMKKEPINLRPEHLVFSQIITEQSL